jgi:hypothetical protein
MAVKTFTTGEVLTAADTNTYLANSGLVFVKQVTVGSAVSSVDVTSCFNSSFSSYRIVLDQISASATLNLGARMLSGTTPATTAYYGLLTYASVTVSGAYVSATDNNASAYSFVCSLGNGNYISAAFDLLNPYDTRETRLGPSAFIKTIGSTDIGTYVGTLFNSTSYDGIRFLPNAAQTLTGGTITVYGYREG